MSADGTLAATTADDAGRIYSAKVILKTVVIVFVFLALVVARPWFFRTTEKGYYDPFFTGLFGVLTSIGLYIIAMVDQYVYKNVLLGLGIAMGFVIAYGPSGK
jgi:hypothetical protein